MATGGGHLVYLEIEDGKLIEKKYTKFKYEISCLDINPIGEDNDRSSLAAVGMWTDISVNIYSLPDLDWITTENLGGEIIPRSVLLCNFEGVSHFTISLFHLHKSKLLRFSTRHSSGILLIMCPWRWSPIEFPIEHEYWQII